MSGDGFLSRWARRKAEQRLTDETPGAAADAVAGSAPDVDVALSHPSVKDGHGPGDTLPAIAENAVEMEGVQHEDALSEEELAALPPVEEMTADSDLTIYLRKGVPAAMRNAAMRRMWGLNPAISTYLDPARDYFWDYNAPATITGFGGTLSPGDAAAYVARLLRPGERSVDDEAGGAPSEVAEAPGTVEGDTEDEMASPAAGEDLASGEPKQMPDVWATEDAPPKVATNLDQDTGVPKEPDRSFVRRKHGGALPRS
jgi:hypothetical protein